MSQSTAPMGLDELLRRVGSASAKGLPPVERWNPPFCGEIDMRIAEDGSWHYMNSPIGRLALVRLFSTILRKDEDRYVLVTPVERVGIRVDDVPFLAVEMMVDDSGAEPALAFRTNVDDWTLAGPEHPMRFETGAAGGLRPYVHVRAGLWARLTRPLFLDLAERAESETVDGVEMLGVRSGGAFFPMDRA